MRSVLLEKDIHGLGKNHWFNEMLQYQQPQQERIHATDVGPTDAPKPNKLTKKQLNSMFQCLQSTTAKITRG